MPNYSHNSFYIFNIILPDNLIVFSIYQVPAKDTQLFYGFERKIRVSFFYACLVHIIIFGECTFWIRWL
jgi:hypothetical protein